MFESRKPLVFVVWAMLAGVVLLAGVAVPAVAGAEDAPGSDVPIAGAVYAVGVGAPVTQETAAGLPALPGIPLSARVVAEDRQVLAEVLSRMTDLRGLYFAGFFDDAEDMLTEDMGRLSGLQRALAAEPTSAALALEGALLWPQLADDEAEVAARMETVASLFPAGNVREGAHPPELIEALDEVRASLPVVEVVHPSSCSPVANGLINEGSAVPMGSLPLALRLACPDGESDVVVIEDRAAVLLLPPAVAEHLRRAPDGTPWLRAGDEEDVHRAARAVLQRLSLDGLWVVPAEGEGDRCLVRRDGAVCVEASAPLDTAALLAFPCTAQRCVMDATATAIALDVQPARAPAAPREGAAVPAEEVAAAAPLSARQSRPGPAGISMIVATGISAGVASGLMVREFQQHDRYTTCRDDVACRQDAERVGGYEDDWEAARLRSRIGWGLTAGLAAGTVAVLLLERPEARRQQRAARTALVPGPGEVGVGLRTRW